jgi:Transmembrane protein family 132
LYSVGSSYQVAFVVVQVVLRSGRVVGTREVKVSSDRVNIDRLEVSVVSGLSVKVDKKVDFPGALAVLVAKTKTLHHRYQVFF